MRPRAGIGGLEQRLLASWRRLPPRSSAAVVVGFSGGGDSLALAAALGRIASLGNLSPTLVHIDHAWRATSRHEQRAAMTLASGLGLPFHAFRVPDEARAGHPGVGNEEAARRERYRLLAAAARAVGTDLIALAHHQDDQAETVLLHLLRGAGLAGASGMREVRQMTIPWWEVGREEANLLLWRPFLCEPRTTIRAYAAATGLTPLMDPSNDDPAFRRNLLRAEAMPLLERIAPGATAALARFAALAAADDEALHALAAGLLRDAMTADRDLVRSRVMTRPPSVRRRLIRQWVQHAHPIALVTAERTEAMIDLLERGEPGKRVEIGDGWSVAATRGGLRIDRAPAAERQTDPR
ncbi:MAG: tRNA lysidine(34) synthetase TilS [Chloroflexota bacterium]|nr:tRNA lysidine(34) synthetase TilS [Chloroflexota bacterium]